MKEVCVTCSSMCYEGTLFGTKTGDAIALSPALA